MKHLEGKTALVTGASRGIGQAVALALAKQGCSLILHARQEENLKATLEAVSREGVSSYVVAAQLDCADSIHSLIERVQALDVDVDILYNNAAINNESTPVFEFTLAEWQKTFQINFFAVVQLCAAFAPAMKQRGWGRIVNVTSGIADQPNLAPYSASKAAIDKYTQDLAVEFKDSGVLINHVDPGWIRTDLGGPDAWEDVSSVIPGMLVPVLLPDGGSNGRLFAAQDFKGWNDA